MVVSNSTIIPVTMAANTTALTLSSDLTVGNTTTFPTLSNLSKNFDKVKWHKCNLEYVPAVPTTTGGNAALFFDPDRTDVGPTSVTQALQNARCVITPAWQKIKYSLTKAMLRTNEWFTSDTNPIAAAPSPQTNNTFASPGRIQLYITPLLGVTFTTATIVGYIKVDYTVEFGFPSGESSTTAPPTRRYYEQPRDVSHISYDSRHVTAWQHFAAGCVSPPDFYTFASLLDERGKVRRQLAQRFEPDELSYALNHCTLYENTFSALPLLGEEHQDVEQWRDATDLSLFSRHIEEVVEYPLISEDV